jgi:hypothetical protein
MSQVLNDFLIIPVFSLEISLENGKKEVKLTTTLSLQSALEKSEEFFTFSKQTKIYICTVEAA